MNGIIATTPLLNVTYILWF